MKTGLGEESTTSILSICPLLFSEIVYLHVQVFITVCRCVFVLRCVCIMSGSSTLIQQCFTFDLFQRGANREQTAMRPRLAVCLQQYARNFSSIYSARPIKAALPRMLSGKHL